MVVSDTGLMAELASAKTLRRSSWDRSLKRAHRSLADINSLARLWLGAHRFDLIEDALVCGSALAVA